MTTEHSGSGNRDREAGASTVESNGRRRFLKGTTLALPAVTTLTPGTALALTSVTCGQRGLDSGLTADFLLIPPSNTDDGHYRLPVTLYDKLVPYEHDGQVTMVPSGQPTYFEGLDDGQACWRSCVDGSVVGTSQPGDINTQPNLQHGTGYALVHISAYDGSIVACGAPDNPPDAIITSAAGACMNSLAMNQP